MLQREADRVEEIGPSTENCQILSSPPQLEKNKGRGTLSFTADLASNPKLLKSQSKLSIKTIIYYRLIKEVLDEKYATNATHLHIFFKCLFIENCKSLWAKVN